MSVIRFNVLSDKTFPHGCYRTLVEYKGSSFLGISVVCGGIFTFRLFRVFDSLEKCSETELFALKSVKPYTLYLFLALISTPQSFLNYTLSDIIAVVKQ